MWYTYAFMFPVSIIVATIAMSLGIGGAVFFSPIFIIVFPLVGVGTLEPSTAFGAALLTELVGFSSGLFAHAVFRRSIDYRTALMVCMCSLPPSMLCTIAKHHVNKKILFTAFAVSLFLLAMYTVVFRYIRVKLDADMEKKALLHKGGPPQPPTSLAARPESFNSLDLGRAGSHTSSMSAYDFHNSSFNSVAEGNLKVDHLSIQTNESSIYDDDWSGRLYQWMFERSIIVGDGRQFNYSICRPQLLMFLVALGAGMTGFLSVGIGETCTTGLNSQCKLPMILATGTSVLVVTATVLTSVATEIMLDSNMQMPWTLVMWTCPGVLIGGQIGPKVAQKISHHAAENALVVVLFSLSIVMGVVAGLTIMDIDIPQL